MKNVLIAGGTGLVGQRLAQILKEKGYNVMLLSRRANPKAAFPTYAWDVEKGTIDAEAFAQADYIVNLAGAGIADKRWSEARKREIIDSRVKSTELLKNLLASTPNRVKAYLSASAIGYYGDRGADWMHEDSPQGSGFLAESTIAWENAVAEVPQTGVRTVALRIGVVLSVKGGALEKMLLPFLFRMGVYFGSGEQYFSWIHIDDLCAMFLWAIENESVSGTFNAVAPQPLSNYDLTKAVADAKEGFYLMMPAPAFALRLGMGEMADVVLNSTRVSAEKAESAGFKFQYPEAVMALKDVLRRKV